MHNICDSLSKPLMEVIILLLISIPQKNEEFPNFQRPVTLFSLYYDIFL